MNRLAGAAALLLFLIFPAAVYAAVEPPLTVSPGCRLATQRDQEQRAARGIPPAFQVCPGDELYLGIGHQGLEQTYARLMQVPKCAKSVCNLACQTNNTGAQVCGPTATKWNARACHRNNRTAIFPSVPYGFAAHIELLRRYCAEGIQGKKRCTIADVHEIWSTGNKAEYARFVSQYSGMPYNQVFSPNDMELMGRIALVMACLENDGIARYNLEELKQGLAMASGGPRVAEPPNVGEIINRALDYNGPSGFPGTPSAFPQNFNYPVGAINGNGNYNPNAAQTNPFPSPMNQIPNSNGLFNNPAGSQGILGDPAYNIVVWPESLSKGQSLMVIWTSVNFPKDVCQVQYDNQEFAKGNEGAKEFKTTSFDSGTLTFTLKCTDSGGQIYQASDSATLK